MLVDGVLLVISFLDTFVVWVLEFLLFLIMGQQWPHHIKHSTLIMMSPVGVATPGHSRLAGGW